MKAPAKTWWLTAAGIAILCSILFVFREQPDRDRPAVPEAQVGATRELADAGAAPAVNSGDGRDAGTSAVPTPGNENPDAVASTTLARVQFLLVATDDALMTEERANWLKAPFSPDELAFLKEYLESAETHGRTVEEDAAVRNGLMNALRRDPDIVPQLEELFYRMAGNPGQPAVFRDYALQHLVSLAQSTEASPAVEQLLATLAADGQGSVAGTALLGLVRIEGVRPDAERRELIRYRAVLGAYDEANVEVRMTALALAGDLGEQAGLQAAVEVLHQSGSVALRVAAIGTIGKLGGAGEAGLLRRILIGDEHYLKAAAEKAMLRIDERSP